MRDILLLHGAWHGGWCWEPIAACLRLDGHRVHAPSMFGLSESAHHLTPEVGLQTHVEQITALIEELKLESAVVCAHSYGGAVLRILEDRRPEAIGAAVYLEGAIPAPGCSVLDLNPPDVKEERERIAATLGDGWRLPVPDVASLWAGLTRAQAESLTPQLTDQPFRAFQDRQPTEPRWSNARHVYVYANDRNPQPYQTVIDAFKQRDWETIGMTGGHELMITRPHAVLRVIRSVIARSASMQL